MRLQISGLIGDGPIGRGMALVEAVLGEQHHLVEQLIGHLLVNAAFRCPLHEDAAMLLHLSHLLLTHGPTKKIGLSQGIPRQILRDAHDLLLVNHDSVGLAENRLKDLVSEINRLTSMLAVDELGNQSGIQRSGPVQGEDRGDVLQ